MLKGAHLGRGCICSACAVINKEIPPYAVVAGVPAKIIAVKFSKDQIIEHEKKIYKPEERFTDSYLDILFEMYFKDKKVYGTSDLKEEDLIKLEKYKSRKGVNYVV